MKDIFTGKLVRLSGFDPDEMSKAWSRWYRNSEYARLLNSSARPLQSSKAEQKWMEEETGEPSPGDYFFAIRRLADHALIGELMLEVVNWSGGDAFVGLSIGEPESWNQGYGTDIMNVLLRFAFTEVNLKRVSLGVFEYNPRAIRSYEKAGFRHEGHLRSLLNREGRRWNNLFMGIQREEWQALNRD